MATNYTTNYQLNQWEPTDQVLRTDFNQDNAKIEAALDNHRQQLSKSLRHAQLLKTAQIPGNTRQYAFDVGDISWDDWEYLIFSYDRGGATNWLDGSDGEIILNLLGGDNTSYSSHGISIFARIQPNSFALILLPYHDSTRKAQGICIGSTSSYGFGGGTFAETTSIYLSLSGGNNYLPNSAVMELWGVK